VNMVSRSRATRGAVFVQPVIALLLPLLSATAPLTSTAGCCFNSFSLNMTSRKFLGDSQGTSDWETVEVISLNGAYRLRSRSANSNNTELGLQSANRTFQWTQHNATSPIECTSKPGVDVERLQQCFGGMARPGKVVNIIDFPDVLGTTVILGRALQLFGNNQDGVTTTMAVDIEDGQCIPVYQKSQNIVTYSDNDQLVLYHDIEMDVQLPGSAFAVPGECYKAIQD